MARFRDILALGPVRFYISPKRHFGGDLALLGVENSNSEKMVAHSPNFQVIPNCKPGIWTSRTRKLKEQKDGEDLGDLECILYWIADGEINLAQSVDDWKKYEEETRDKDVSVKLSQIVPKDTKWRKAGSYYDDGGICNIISTVYLTEEAAKKIMFEGEEEKDLNYTYYVESLTLGYRDNDYIISHARNWNCTLGGMSFGQDAVGGPPNIALAEDENGQVIALRMYKAKIPEGEDEPPVEGPEDGFTSADDEEVYVYKPLRNQKTWVIAEKYSDMTPQQIRVKKEREILSLRHNLQKSLLSKDHEPIEEDIELMSEYISQLEADTNLEASIIRITKINKVLKAILKRDNIPKEDEFSFRPRLQALLDKWNVLLEGYQDAPEFPTINSSKPHERVNVDTAQVISAEVANNAKKYEEKAPAPASATVTKPKEEVFER
ncbi:hypothetical protein F5884DRAFT_745116 [Xylogone sp. PMI_703]|nr:hypothetical protein F5884DRAFT_745116 [Xylogone sp. PMI_703]